jgi:hypothetical protein
MQSTARGKWTRSALVVAVVYAVIGVVTAALAGAATSPQMRTAWRLAGWLLSLATFLSHLTYERIQLRSSVKAGAGHVAAAVALGAFVLAAVGPVRSHWDAADFWRVSVLSLPLWPLLTGVPAFLVALVAGAVLKRFGRRSPSASSNDGI